MIFITNLYCGNNNILNNAIKELIERGVHFERGIICFTCNLTHELLMMMFFARIWANPTMNRAIERQLARIEEEKRRKKEEKLRKKEEEIERKEREEEKRKETEIMEKKIQKWSKEQTDKGTSKKEIKKRVKKYRWDIAYNSNLLYEIEI